MSSIRITRNAGKDVSISMHKTSRLKSSMMFKVRLVLSLSRLSLIKSSDQLWLALSGCSRGFGNQLATFFGDLSGYSIPFLGKYVEFVCDSRYIPYFLGNLSSCRIPNGASFLPVPSSSFVSLYHSTVCAGTDKLIG